MTGADAISTSVHTAQEALENGTLDMAAFPLTGHESFRRILPSVPMLQAYNTGIVRLERTGIGEWRLFAPFSKEMWTFI